MRFSPGFCAIQSNLICPAILYLPTNINQANPNHASYLPPPGASHAFSISMLPHMRQTHVKIKHVAFPLNLTSIKPNLWACLKRISPSQSLYIVPSSSQFISILP